MTLPFVQEKNEAGEAMANFKYVILKVGADEYPIIFPEALEHERVAASLLRLQQFYDPSCHVVSAGFVQFGNGNVIVKSKVSESLGIGPREIDALVIGAYPSTGLPRTLTDEFSTSRTLGVRTAKQSPGTVPPADTREVVYGASKASELTKKTQHVHTGKPCWCGVTHRNTGRL